MTAKTDHVRAAKQTRSHTCHWPGCDKQVPPAMCGCKPHWFMLPPAIRRAIWDSYQPGQEVRMDPSEAYLLAAKDAEEFARGAMLERAEKAAARVNDNKTRPLF